MPCHSGVSAVLAVFIAGACVAALVPNVFWAHYDIAGSKVEVSLWRQCITADDVTECSKIEKPSKDDFKDEGSAERDGAIAGLVLGGLFALISTIGVCCHKKAV